MKLLLALVLFSSSSALALTPRAFLESVAGNAGWSVPTEANYCASIAENGRKSSWPATPTSPLKYISSLQFISDREAKYTKSDVEAIQGMKPNQAWRSYQGAYSRIYNGVATPAYVFNFVVIDGIDDSGPTGNSFICVGIYSER